jgi:hypothetical protein
MEFIKPLTMKPIIYRSLFFFIMFFFSYTIFSQTADEIIEKHIAAHGGAEKWDRVDALKITGKFTAFSLENDYTCYKTRSGYYYADLYLGEVNVIEAFNGKTGWTIDPWQEIDYARKVNSSEENVFLQKAEFFTPFYNYKEKGHSVEYEGRETMDGFEVFVLKLTRANGHVETWYLNAETYLEYLCKSDWVDFAYPAPSEVFFDDFREVDGLILPFFTDRTFWQRSRILEIKNVEINPEIDKEIFVMPQREEMSKFEFLEGKWDVNVKAWTPRGTWYDLGNTTSAFEFVSPNMLQEKITYERIFLISRTTNYTWNESGDNYRISVFNDLSSSLDFYEGAFNDTAFIFDDSNITFGDVAEEDNPINRYIIYNIEKDGFIMERKVSTDDGENWGPRDKFTYTRREE